MNFTIHHCSNHFLYLLPKIILSIKRALENLTAKAIKFDYLFH